MTIVNIARARHVRHRDFDGVTRGAEGAKGIPRLKKLGAWLAARSDTTANGGIGDTAALTAFTVNIVDVAATGTLTLTGQPLDTETVTIGATTYVFQTALVDSADNVLVGATASDSIDNLIAAVSAGAGAGTLYGTGTVANASTTIVVGAGDTADLTAITSGLIGNSIVTTETLTNGSFGAVTLTGGEDGETLNAVSHGLTTPSGPLILTTSDTLPAGLSLTQLYWARAVDVDNLALFSKRSDAEFDTSRIDITDTGTGIHNFARAADIPGLIEWLRQENKPETIQALTDIDAL